MCGGSRGHSLIEILVALLILTGGLLGVAATSVVAERWTIAARARLRAVAAMRRRMESLRPAQESGVGECGAPGNGAALDGFGLGEQWRIDSTGDGSQITIVGTYPTPGGRSSDTLATILDCR